MIDLWRDMEIIYESYIKKLKLVIFKLVGNEKNGWRILVVVCDCKFFLYDNFVGKVYKVSDIIDFEFENL